MVSSSRRNWNSILTLLCLVYSGYITLKILSQITSSNTCVVEKLSGPKVEVGQIETRSNVEKPDAPVEFGSGKYMIEYFEEDLLTYEISDSIENDEEGRFKIAKAEEELIKTMKDTNYFGCTDLDIIPRTRKKVEENTKGNRGISFLRIRVDGKAISVVLKEANRHFQTPVEEYKFNSARKEILYLRKLRGLRGVPKLYGSCIEDYRIRYLVERVEGSTLCNDNGTTPYCATGEYLTKLVEADRYPELAALSLAYSTVNLLRLLEDRHLFMEDISGINFMVSRDWELYLVDADSLVFYNDSRIYSEIYCSVDKQCPEPNGNLWIAKSLNVRIYENCEDHRGLCNYKRCRGFGVELHACGMSNWYLCNLKRVFPGETEIYEAYSKLCSCMSERHPYKRCSFNEAAKQLRQLYKKFYRSKAKEILISNQNQML